MSQEIKVGVSADTGAAVQKLREIDKATDAVAESLKKVERAGKEAAGAVRQVADMATRIKNAQGILSKELGRPIQPGDAQRFVDNYDRMRASGGMGASRLRAFDDFDGWYQGHGATFNRAADAHRHRRFVMAVGMQGTSYAAEHGIPMMHPSGAPPGHSPGGAGPREQPSEFQKRVERARGQAMGYGRGMLALAGISGVFSMASSALDMAGEEATGVDTLKRRIGDVGLAFESLKEATRKAGEGLGYTHVESSRLAQQMARTVGTRGDTASMNSVRQAMGFSRAFGIEGEEGVGLFGAMRHAKVIGSDAESSRRFASMIADAIDASGYVAKADEIAQSVADFTTQAARSSFSIPNVAAYMANFAGLTGAGFAGMDPAAASSMLARANSAMMRGGNMGEASMNMMYGALANGTNPIVAKALMTGGLFGTTRGVFGGGIGEWFRRNGIELPAMSDETNFDKVRNKLRASYGNDKWLYIDALQNVFGLNSPQEAIQMDMMEPADISQSVGLLGRLRKMADPSSVLAVSRIARARNMSELGESYTDVMGRPSSQVSDQEKDRLKTLYLTGGFSELQEALAAIVAEKGQTKTEGTQLRESLVELKDVLTRIGAALLPWVADIRDGVSKMAGVIAPGPTNKQVDAGGSTSTAAVARAVEIARGTAQSDSSMVGMANQDWLAGMAETDKLLGLPAGSTMRQLMAESSLDPNAFNRKSGAMGLAQVTPKTLEGVEKALGRKLNPFDPMDAIAINRFVMGQNLNQFGTYERALRGYNSGWDTSKWDNPETNAYIQKLMPLPDGAAPGGRDQNVNVTITGQATLPVNDQHGRPAGEISLQAHRQPTPQGSSWAGHRQ